MLFDEFAQAKNDVSRRQARRHARPQLFAYWIASETFPHFG
jgi:hypothetical protein